MTLTTIFNVPFVGGHKLYDSDFFTTQPTGGGEGERGQNGLNWVLKIW